MRAVIFAYIAFIAIVFIGWVMNILALVHMGSDTILSGLGVLRIIGVPMVPLGAVMGYFF